MNYGLYLSAGGALASMHRENVLANNLANLNTIGFKPDHVDARQRLPARLEDAASFADPQMLLEQLGGGLLVEPTRVGLDQGALIASGRSLDVAIDGEGFFVVAPRAGAAASEERLTRDGRWTTGPGGALTTEAGLLVLDEVHRPIQVDPALPVAIDAGGAISQEGAIVAQLRIVAVGDGRDVAKAGANLLRLRDGAAVRAASGRVRQGHTEASAVDPILTMHAMMSAAKAAQSNLKMMQYHDQVLGQAFNTFGRVA
jgi:flagellar basal body rod protein FlgG